MGSWGLTNGKGDIWLSTDNIVGQLLGLTRRVAHYSKLLIFEIPVRGDEVVGLRTRGGLDDVLSGLVGQSNISILYSIYNAQSLDALFCSNQTVQGMEFFLHLCYIYIFFF